jgi:hypothetical protein
MENLVTINDFVGEYVISDQGYALENFTYFIAQKQEDYLLACLGAKLYEDFLANPTEQKWVDFVNGKFYDDCSGYRAYYGGIKTVLLPYIYAEFLIFNQKKVLNTGTVQTENENSTNLNDYQLKSLYYQHFNTFVDYNNKLYRFLYTFNSTYTDIECYFKHYKKQGFVTITTAK